MDRFLHQHNIHSNFYILNPQTNTQKQNTEKGNEPPKKKKKKKTQTTKSLSDLTITSSSVTKTTTTMRFLLLHEGEGGSVSECE